MPRPPKPAAIKPVDSFLHADTRLNIPTAELQSLAQQAEEHDPIPVAHYPRARALPPNNTRPRDEDRDPQVVWQGVTPDHPSVTLTRVAAVAARLEGAW